MEFICEEERTRLLKRNILVSTEELPEK